MGKRKTACESCGASKPFLYESYLGFTVCGQCLTDLAENDESEVPDLQRYAFDMGREWMYDHPEEAELMTSEDRKRFASSLEESYGLPAKYIDEGIESMRQEVLAP